MRAASELGLRTVAVHSDDDAASLHTRKADEARVARRPRAGRLPRHRAGARSSPPRPAPTRSTPATGSSPRTPAFARRCAEAGITFVGPVAGGARAVRRQGGGPGAGRAARRARAAGHARRHRRRRRRPRSMRRSVPAGAIMLKATAGGGGRGSRIVTDADELAGPYERCRSEAASAFGDGTLFAEELVARARHIEVQIVGDGTGAVSHLWERECSLQRRHQKLVEIAPAPHLDPTAARRPRSPTPCGWRPTCATAASGRSSSSSTPTPAATSFIEANPRLQVEHTVTEEVLGIDLVRAQLELAGGRTLAELGLDQATVPAPRGIAVQCRVNMETMAADGTARPAAACSPRSRCRPAPATAPTRSATPATARARASTRCWPRSSCTRPRPTCADAARRRPTGRSPSCAIEGVADEHRRSCRRILDHPDVVAGAATTRFVDDHIAELVAGRRRPGAPLLRRRAAAAAAAPRPGRRQGRRRRPAGRARLRHGPARPDRRRRAAPPGRRRARRAGRHDRRARAAAGHGRRRSTSPTATRSRRPAAARHGGDEDGARRRRHRGRLRAPRRRRPSATPSSRATRSCSSSRPTSATS